MSETAKLGFPSIIEILDDVQVSLAGSIQHAPQAALIQRCTDALRIWAVNGWDDVTPQPAPADAVTEAAVRAAREWYGRVTALQPLPIQPGTLEHVIILKGRDAAEWHFAAQVRSFRVQFEIEAHRLLDAGGSEVRG